MECHGTGTPLGDPIEIGGLKSINASRRFSDVDMSGSVCGHSGIRSSGTSSIPRFNSY